MWSQTTPIKHSKGALTNNNKAQQNNANEQRRLETYQWSTTSGCQQVKRVKKVPTKHNMRMLMHNALIKQKQNTMQL
jgi:hypothetical protein